MRMVGPTWTSRGGVVRRARVPWRQSMMVRQVSGSSSGTKVASESAATSSASGRSPPFPGEPSRVLPEWASASARRRRSPLHYHANVGCSSPLIVVRGGNPVPTSVRGVVFSERLRRSDKLTGPGARFACVHGGFRFLGGRTSRGRGRTRPGSGASARSDKSVTATVRIAAIRCGTRRSPRSDSASRCEVGQRGRTRPGRPVEAEYVATSPTLHAVREPPLGLVPEPPETPRERVQLCVHPMPSASCESVSEGVSRRPMSADVSARSYRRARRARSSRVNRRAPSAWTARHSGSGANENARRVPLRWARRARPPHRATRPQRGPVRLDRQSGAT